MLKIRKMMKRQKGFTLVELIVVIAILAILALIAIPKFVGTFQTSRIRAHNANVRTIESAMAVYQAETGDAATNIDDDLVGEYLKENPTVPLKDGDPGFEDIPADGKYDIIDGEVKPAMVAETDEDGGGGGTGK